MRRDGFTYYSMHCLEHAAVCIAVATLSNCYPIQLSFTLVKNRSAESESKSPGVEATRQESESESESESIKLPRVRLRVVYYDSTRVRASQIFFSVKFSAISPFLTF